MEVIDLEVITSLPGYSECMIPGISNESYMYNFLLVYWNRVRRMVEIFDPEYREKIAISLIKNRIDIINYNKLSSDEKQEYVLKLYNYRENDSEEVIAKRLVAFSIINKDAPGFGGNGLKPFTIVEASKLIQENSSGIKYKDRNYSVLNYYEMRSGFNYRDIKWEKLFHITQLENSLVSKNIPFEVADYANNKLYYFEKINEAPAWDQANKLILQNRLEQSKFDLVKQHIEKRFQELEQILKRRYTATVLFPGHNSKNHSLGTGIAANAWKDKNIHKRMVDLISENIEKMKKKFGKRVQFGTIGFIELLRGTPYEKSWIADPSLNFVHVWGANDNNWNTRNNTLKQTLGAAQASVLYQRPGVFGIVTMPTDDKSILDKDVNLEDYFVNIVVPVSDRTTSKFVAQGSYGCVYTPNIRCASVQDPSSPIKTYDVSGTGQYLNVRSLDLVSKVFGSDRHQNIVSEIQNEVNEGIIIDKIDPQGKYHFGVKAVCKIEAQPTEASKCKLNPAKVPDAYQILYEYGGTEYAEYIYKAQLYPNVFLTSLHSLFEGLVAMHENRYSHLDIKVINIVTKASADNMNVTSKYIDFGLAKKWDNLLTTEVPYLAMTHHYENSTTIKEYMNMPDPKQRFLFLNSYLYLNYPVEMCFLRLDFFRIVIECLKYYAPAQLTGMILGNDNGYISRHRLTAMKRCKYTHESPDNLINMFRQNMTQYLIRIKTTFTNPQEIPALMNKMRLEILEKVDVYSLGVCIIQTIHAITTRNKDLKDPIVPAMKSLGEMMAYPLTHLRFTPQKALLEYREIVSKYKI